MILLIDTSTPECRITLVGSEVRRSASWQADRTLAKGLLGFLAAELSNYEKGINDLTGIGTFKGPGSFTGLRIGMTVANTLASGLSIPIVGEQGEDWQDQALARLASGADDRIVMPLYGSEARITAPRK